MRVPSIVLLCLLGSACGDVGEEAVQSCGPTETAEALAYADQVAHLIRGEELRAVVAELASDDYEGRAPGTAGDVMAREWIEARLAEANIAPGADQGYQQPFELVDVADHAGAYVGIEHGGADPVVLPDLRQDIPGRGDERSRHRLRADVRGSLLVGGVQEGPQEADGDRFDALG